MRRPDLAVVFLALGVATAAVAAAPTPEEKLEAVQHTLDASRKDSDELARKAQALQADIAKLQAQAVAAAQSAQANERQLTTLERALEKLAADEASQRATIDQRRQREATVLAALERVASTPPAAMMFAPGAPVDLARGGMVLSAAVPQLEAMVKDLLTALADLQQTEADIVAKKAELAERQHALDADRQRVAQLLDQKRALQGQTRQDAAAAQKRVAALSAQAADLKQLIQRLEQDRQEKSAAERQPAPPSSEHAAGSLLNPVSGTITERFGAAESAGTSKGITFTTRPGAQVVAPTAGEIMFAGPFKGYGQILIIDRGGGYHCLLAGLGRIEGAVGQHVVAGEPVGTMSKEGTPTLYLELRKQEQPLDPLPWLAATDGKASG